eukprot:jgi/Astpho2/9500/Aster-01751
MASSGSLAKLLTLITPAWKLGVSLAPAEGVALPERLRHVTAEHTFVVALFLKAQLLLFTQGIDLWLSIPFATGLMVLTNIVLSRKWHTQRWFQMVLLLGAIVTLFPYSLFQQRQRPAAAPEAQMQMQQRRPSPEQNPSRLRTPEEAERMISAMRAAEAARRR